MCSKIAAAYFGSLREDGGVGTSDAFLLAAAHSDRDCLEVKVCLNCFDTRESCSRSTGLSMEVI